SAAMFRTKQTLIYLKGTLSLSQASTLQIRPLIIDFRQFASMAQNPLSSDKGTEEQFRETCGKEACEFIPSKGSSTQGLIPHILNLYASTATARDFEIYAPHATFEDPLMCAHGLSPTSWYTYGENKVFSESRIVEYTINENIIAPGKKETLTDNKQYYKFLGRDIHMISLIKLYVEEGKVVRHEDWWDKKPLRNRETEKLPLFGRILEITRRGSMLVTHAMMGFGKDQTV
ncbi:hypothetical protein RJ641_036466, partial [Dillenia turbinata]